MGSFNDLYIEDIFDKPSKIDNIHSSFEDELNSKWEKTKKMYVNDLKITNGILNEVRDENGAINYEESEFSYDLDRLVKLDLNKYITDKESYRIINDLRFMIAVDGDCLNEVDKEYLISIGYDEEKLKELLRQGDYLLGMDSFREGINFLYGFFHDKKDLLDVPFEGLWQFLLTTREHLSYLGLNEEEIDFVDKVLNKYGYHLKDSKGIEETAVTDYRPLFHTAKSKYFDAQVAFDDYMENVYKVTGTHIYGKEYDDYRRKSYELIMAIEEIEKKIVK